MFDAKLAERFWSKVAPAEAMACWNWTAGSAFGGYGKFKVQGSYRPAHRVAYEMLRAEIPRGLVIDHLCRNRKCVNPWHLEPVTHQVNVQRGRTRRYNTHCKSGHPFTPENTRVVHRPMGTLRRCRVCERRYRPKAVQA